MKFKMFPAEAFRETLNKVVALFRKHAVPFHLTGGVTSVFYGEPRMTQDVDVVAQNEALANSLGAFIQSLESSDFIHNADEIRRAVSERGMFQLLDRIESLKIDVYPRELIPGELSRSSLKEVFQGEQLPIASRADAAASKLVWIQMGSHKSRRDLRHIYRNGDAGEQLAIEDLADHLKLRKLFDEVLDEPDEVM